MKTCVECRKDGTIPFCKSAEGDILYVCLPCWKAHDYATALTLPDLRLPIGLPSRGA